MATLATDETMSLGDAGVVHIAEEPGGELVSATIPVSAKLQGKLSTGCMADELTNIPGGETRDRCLPTRVNPALIGNHVYWVQEEGVILPGGHDELGESV